MNNKISIIIPTWNEEGNIKFLIEHIDWELKQNNIEYEIIVIDDHSTDQTQKIVGSIKNLYPVSLHVKKGNQGKAQSLLEGFSLAKYDLICMIDADLQYPPEVIPQMIEKISDNVDIVIANRRERYVSFKRKV